MVSYHPFLQTISADSHALGNRPSSLAGTGPSLESPSSAPPAGPPPSPPKEELSTMCRKPDIALHRVSMIAQQSGSPRYIDSPGSRPGTASAQMPMKLASHLRASDTANLAFALSPAQDDKSIVDPESSPLPFSMSLTSIPAMPTPKAEASSVRAKSRMAKRQQSLSELKDAFTRMRDLSELDRLDRRFQTYLWCRWRDHRRGAQSNDKTREESGQATKSRSGWPGSRSPSGRRTKHARRHI